MGAKRRTIRISRRAAQAAGHPELAGRRLRLVRHAGTTRYYGQRGELRGRAFSRSLVERVRRIESELPVSAQQHRAEKVRRLQQDLGFSYGQAVKRAAAEHRVDHDDYVTRLQRELGISRTEAERRIRDAERILRQPRERQSDSQRTQALRDLGQIGRDAYYRGGVLVEAGLGAA